MNQPLTVIIVEDDVSTCNSLVAALDSENEQFSVLGTTNNSTDAVRMVLTEHPEAVILDLELHCGGGDGIDFLQRLRKSDLPYTPFILVTTNNVSSIIHKTVRDLGADFIFTKVQKDYSEKTVVDFLLSLKSTIQAKKSAQTAGLEVVSPSQQERRLRHKICDELDKVGISGKAMGYEYLVSAIVLAINGTSQHFCVEIGKQVGKTKDSVERAMQNAINRAWTSTETNTLYENYTARINPERGVPTVTEFIFYYARKIQNKT